MTHTHILIVASGNTVVIEEGNLQNYSHFSEVSVLLMKTRDKTGDDRKAGRTAVEQANELKLLEDGKNGKLFFAKINGKIVGFAFGADVSHPKLRMIGGNWQAKDGERDYAYIISAVLPEFQRKGIATLLNAAREKHARELGCKRIYGMTPTSNTGRVAQFEKEGFVRVQPKNPGRGYSDDIIFVKHLG